MKRSELKGRNRDIILELRKGKSVHEVAIQFNLTSKRLRQIAAPYGLLMSRSKIHERHKNIVKDFNTGIDERKLAARYKLGYEGICQILKSKVKNYVPNDFRRTASLYGRICADYIAGFTIEKIARKFKMSITRIRQILKNSGLYHPVQRNPDAIKERRQHIIEALKKGTALLEICIRFKVGQETVRRIVYPEGLQEKYLASRKKRNQQLVLDYKSGLKEIDLANKYWTTPNDVKTIINRKKVRNSIKEYKLDK